MSEFFMNLNDSEKAYVIKTVGSFRMCEPYISFYEFKFAALLGEYYKTNNNGYNNALKAVKNFKDCLRLYDIFLTKLRANSDNMQSFAEEFSEEAKKLYYYSMVELGICYYNGFGTTKDYSKALKYFEQASDEYNDDDAQNLLGCMYGYGHGVELDLVKSADYFEKSAIQGNIFAQNSLGRLYEIGKGRDKDIQRAVYWYKKASEQGDDLATENLMRLQGADIDFMGSYEFPNTSIKAADIFNETKNAAEHGDFYAQCELVNYYLNGVLVVEDKQKAIALGIRYADAGNPFAQYELGALYQQNRDREKAFHYFMLAASQGHISAKYNVGQYYCRGYGVEQNLRQSFQWLLSAAEDEHPDAQFRAFLYYFFGIGCTSNHNRAIYWLEKAAEKGHYLAQCSFITLGASGQIPYFQYKRSFASISKMLESNYEKNMGYSKPITRLGNIPEVSFKSAKNKKYVVPENVPFDVLRFLGL